MFFFEKGRERLEGDGKEGNDQFCLLVWVWIGKNRFFGMFARAARLEALLPCFICWNLIDLCC